MQLYAGDLRLGPDEIRVLTLHPGSTDSPMVCELSKICLRDKPFYNALSYVWGDANPRKPIVVNSHPIQVTASLETALRHLRHEIEPSIIWVDAVCIDQSNNEERNAQVRLMGDIYRQAARVYLWIGEGNLESDNAFDSMPTIASGTLDDKARRGTSSCYFSVGNRSWFSRVWILQEMALASEDPIIVCGSRQLPWFIFMSAWQVIAKELFSQAGQTRTVPDAAGNDDVEVLAKIKIDILDDLRTAVQSGLGEDLRKLLLISRTSESTDPRDRIYGLLGMMKAEEETIAPIIVDYALSTAQVLTNATAYIFSKGIGPSFLSGIWLPGVSPAIDGLPSWVPDFSAQTGRKTDRTWGIGFHPPHPLSVSGPGAGADNGRMMNDGRTLQVEALTVDLIDEVVILDKHLPKALSQLAQFEKLIETARKRPVAEEVLGPYFERYRTAEPLWKVLISNKRSSSGYDAAPDAYEQQYQKLKTSSLPPQVYDTIEIDEPGNEYINALRSYMLGRAFFTTKNGLYGLAVPEICAGDEVTIWFGATVPFVVRHEGDFCRLVGGAYVGGIMAGQMVDELYCEDVLDSKTLLVS